MLEKVPMAVPIFTDSSKSVGYGCVFGDKWFAGVWPSARWRELGISTLELYPIYVALFIWSTYLADSTVAIYTDNEALVPVLNKLYAKDKMLRQLLKPLALLCLSHNIGIAARHIPGADNIGPDLLSRGRVKAFLDRFPGKESSSTPIPVSVRPENVLKIF
jgi:hypothetical protein